MDALQRPKELIKTKKQSLLPNSMKSTHYLAEEGQEEGG